MPEGIGKEIFTERILYIMGFARPCGVLAGEPLGCIPADITERFSYNSFFASCACNLHI